jgi:hypothetical protein
MTPSGVNEKSRKQLMCADKYFKESSADEKQRKKHKCDH